MSSLPNALEQMVLDRLDHCVVVVDHRGRVRVWNDKIAAQSGRAKGEVMTCLLSELLPELDAPRPRAALRAALERGASAVLSPTLHGGCLPFGHSVSMTPIRVSERVRWCVVELRDDRAVRRSADLHRSLLHHLGEQRRELDARTHELARVARFDPVTGLANRALFMAHLEREVSRADGTERLGAVAFLDLDHFTAINGNVGQTAADRLLKEIGGRLRNQVRPSDTVARFGGDEFILILTGIDREAHVLVAGRRVTEAFEKPFVVEGQEIRVTASVGLTIFPNQGTGADALLKNAEAAMRRAKDAGRNNCQLYSEAKDGTAVGRAALRKTPKQPDDSAVA